MGKAFSDIIKRQIRQKCGIKVIKIGTAGGKLLDLKEMLSVNILEMEKSA